MKVITNEYFKVLINLDKVTEYVKERKNIKHRLLECIADALGRSYRKAKKVAYVIDEIAYKASDRGFSFNGRETLAQKVGVSLPTVDRAIKLLKDSGRVYVGYRENPNSNGVKTPVIIFKDHMNYERIASILHIVDEVNDKVEKAQTSSEPSVSIDKKNTTNLYLKHEKDNKYPSFNKIVTYVSLKISDALKKNGKGITYLSSYIDKTIFKTEEQAYYEAKKIYHNRLKYQRHQSKLANAPSLDWLKI